MAHLQRSLNKPRATRTMHRPLAKDYNPIQWLQYFDNYVDVDVNSDTFRVYISGTEGPALVLLHGGGYSGLTWALFTKEILSRVTCKILAIDLRGHGETHTSNETDLSLENMINDVLGVVQEILHETDNIILIGHSMGGAVAVHCAQRLPNISALCVIDVVEGTALESLASMQSFLRSRPQRFPNIQMAIQWCYKSGQTQNLESAKVSMPGQIVRSSTGQLAASELMDSSIPRVEDAVTDIPIPPLSAMIPPITEEEPDLGGAMEGPGPSMSYTWRIDLSRTEVFWQGWFKGLSQEFLNARVPKLLLLANIHGLDTALTVGQMQGKFQMQVLPRCGHAIHEDLPHKVADLIAAFLIRHKLTAAIGDFSPVFPAC